MTPRRMVRCTDGHPYDANAHEVCPACGAAPAGQTNELSPAPAPSPAPIPSPTPKPDPTKRIALIGGAIGVMVFLGLAGGAVFYSGKPAKDDPVITKDDAQKKDSPKNDESPKTQDNADAAKQNLPKEAPKDAPKEAANTPDPNDLSSNLKRPPPKSKPQMPADPTEAVIAQFMKVDATTIIRVRVALNPAVHNDIDSRLIDISTTQQIDDTLRLSALLRRVLANQRASAFFRSGNIPKAKETLTTLVALPPIAPGFVDTLAHYGLGFVSSLKGASAQDLTTAGRLFVTAASRGYARAAFALASRSDITQAAGISAPDVDRLFKLAAYQAPGSAEEIAKQRGIDLSAQKTLSSNFLNAVTNRDWATAITLRQSLGAAEVPRFDTFLSERLLPENHDPYMDRVLLGAFIGTLSDDREATEVLGQCSQFGGCGVLKDGPNAAIWMMVTLIGQKDGDPEWANARTRYKTIKDGLMPEQRAAVEQLAHEFKVP